VFSHFEFSYRKIETAAISDYSSQFRDPSSSTGATIKPFVAMAPCGGPIGKKLIYFQQILKQ
jgi:hypothetical protein